MRSYFLIKFIIIVCAVTPAGVNGNGIYM
nr:hypothetical protein BN167_1690001 [Clostridioides difficile E13]